MIGRKLKNRAAVPEHRNIEARLGGKVLFSGDLADLALKDEWVIKKSIEFFDDPEPCFIHRGAVAIRLLNEIRESADNGGTESEYVDYPEGAIITRV